MEDRNCEQLFQYLKSILYDSQVKPLAIEELDEPYRKLGMGLRYLEKAVHEMKDYSEALSKGKLSTPVPPRDNFLCENLKNIHANLNHLTWQAKQVAKGDYSQHVSYLGEFSEAFNTMTEQLREREQLLKQEAENEKDEAHRDTLTGIGNRHFFMEEMEAVLKSGEQAVLCYCDLDHLKYVNDRFGHHEGDWYLCHFVACVRKEIRQEDIFARIGGDEFCIILKRCSRELAERKLQRARAAFEAEKTRPYDKGFSFGILEIQEHHAPCDLEELLQKADAIMYAQKHQRKEDYRKQLE